MRTHWSIVVGPAMLTFIIGVAVGFQICADLFKH